VIHIGSRFDAGACRSVDRVAVVYSGICKMGNGGGEEVAFILVFHGGFLLICPKCDEKAVNPKFTGQTRSSTVRYDTTIIMSP